MDPSGFSAVIGTISSFLGMGSSLISQGAALRQQMQPQQQQQIQQCPSGFKLTVAIKPTGERELVCVADNGEVR